MTMVPGTAAPSFTIEAHKRQLITLSPGADWRKLAAEAGLADIQAYPMRELDAGTVLSVPMHPDAWSSFNTRYCGAGNSFGITGCESDQCQEAQLPVVQGTGAATPAPAGDTRAHTGRVTDASGRPVAGATVVADQPPPQVESILGQVGEILTGSGEDILPQDTPAPAPDPWDPLPPSYATTGANGVYTLSLPTRYSWQIVAAAGWEQASAPLTGPTRVADDGPGTGTPPPGGEGDSGTPTPDGGDDDDPRDADEPVLLGILLVRDDDHWIPEYGNQTTVTAQIYEKAPQARRWRISSRKRPITVQFGERSDQPGQCLNADLPSDPQDSPDLFLPSKENSHSTCSQPEGRSEIYGSCRTNEPVSRQTFVVRSEDFGGWATLRASCPGCLPVAVPADYFPDPDIVPPVADDGDPHSPRHLAVLPKDDNRNQIADKWFWEEVQKPDATDDDDEQPAGNGVKGDGLSAYEEYRGFMVKGSHKRTSLQHKTLFVVNEPGLPIQRFKVASKLEVYEVDTNELGSWSLEGVGRLINFNNDHAHVVDQHGLRLVERDLGDSGTMGRAVIGLLDTLLGRIGPPKHVDEVAINGPAYDRLAALFPDSPSIKAELEATVAHELGHSVCMLHHGNASTDDYDVEHDADLSRDEVSSLTDTITSPDRTVCDRPLPTELRIGEKGDQGSGREECIMRYTGWAHAYIEADGSVGCMPHREPDQTMFCESPAGADFNAGERRAGAASRGDCQHQMQVNDGG